MRPIAISAAMLQLFFQSVAMAQENFEIQPPPGGSVLIGPNKLPGETGTSGQVLTTDGAGTTFWSSPAGSTGATNDTEGPSIDIVSVEECIDETAGRVLYCVSANVTDTSGLASVDFLYYEDGTFGQVGWWQPSSYSAQFFPAGDVSATVDYQRISVPLNSSKEVGFNAVDIYGNQSAATTTVTAQQTAIIPGTYVLDQPVTIDRSACQVFPPWTFTFSEVEVRVSASEFPKITVSMYATIPPGDDGFASSETLLFGELADETALQGTGTVGDQVTGGDFRVVQPYEVSFASDSSSFQATVSYACEELDINTMTYSPNGETTGPYTLNGTLVP